MKAPDKIYLEKLYPDNGVLPNGLNYNKSPTDIEGYIAGIINDKIIEDFRNYMKGE